MIGVALLSLLVGFSGALIPVPLFAMAIQQALLVGWSAGFWLVTGHAVGELILLGLLRLGLGNVLQRPAVTRGISLVGGGVLLYFAWDMVRLAVHGPLATAAGGAAATLSYGKLMLAGLVISITTPTWYLWWATVGIGLIGSQIGKHGRRAWPAFFTGHILADYLWYLFVTTLVALSSHLLSETIHRGLILLCGVGIGVIGLLLIGRAVKNGGRERRISEEIVVEAPV